jgi:NADP-dependent 3-hydroxy acid dehydrogenase YdfG
MIDINVKGLCMFLKPSSLKWIERKSGHIINIGSTAAKEVYPNGNVYCATKHAVDALNQGMRMDLNPLE